MPRSGTKLLRALLDEHPALGVPEIETEFIPYWAKHWTQYGDLSVASNFKNFYDSVVSFPYFTFMERRQRLIDSTVWYDRCEDFSIHGVFKALVLHDIGASSDSKIIWGDKSPSYIGHLPLLKCLFPEAKFIHIIRDVRDYCVSINKAWGKHVVRAACRWKEGVDRARADSASFQGSYLEVRYEDLLESPERELRAVCALLGVKFDTGMLSLSRASENIGDAIGHKSIVSGNSGKYLTSLTARRLRVIEGIAGPTLLAHGYAVHDDIPTITISSMRMRFYQALDAWNLVKSEWSKRGLLGAIVFHARYFKVTRF